MRGAKRQTGKIGKGPQRRRAGPASLRPKKPLPAPPHGTLLRAVPKITATTPGEPQRAEPPTQAIAAVGPQAPGLAPAIMPPKPPIKIGLSLRRTPKPLAIKETAKQAQPITLIKRPWPHKPQLSPKEQAKLTPPKCAAITGPPPIQAALRRRRHR